MMTFQNDLAETLNSFYLLTFEVTVLGGNKELAKILSLRVKEWKETMNKRLM